MRYIFTFLTVLSLGLSAITNAQVMRSLQAVYSVNGGVFGTQNYATVTKVNPADNSVRVIDTIRVTSIQDAKVSGNMLAVAATDSVLLYSTETDALLGKVSYPGVKRLAFAGTKLLVGKYYGSGSFLSIYDVTNLNASPMQVASINQEVSDILVDNDTAWVSYNLPRTNPFWMDSIGIVSAVNINTGAVINTATLGTLGANVNKLFKWRGAVYAIADENALMFKIEQGNFSQVATGIKGGVALNRDVLYASVKLNGSGIGSRNMVTGAIDSNIVTAPSILAAVFDTINLKFYINRTDYASLKVGEVYSQTGSLLGTYSVADAPEALALYYSSIPSSVANRLIGIELKAYPNPASDFITLETEDLVSWKVFDNSGKLSLSGKDKRLNLSALLPGSYLLKVQSSVGEANLRFNKQ